MDAIYGWVLAMFNAGCHFGGLLLNLQSESMIGLHYFGV